jgi:molecular chaperone HscA
MLKESFGSAKADMNLRAMRELQVDADRLIEATQSALRQDGDLLDEQARLQIEQQMRQLKALMREHAAAAQAAGGSEDYRASLKDETDELARLTDSFAAMRMDRAIQRALSGKTISELSAEGGAALDRSDRS